MELWAVLQLVAALVSAVSSIAIILGKLHVIERAEEQEWLKHQRQSIPTPR